MDEIKGRKEAEVHCGGENLGRERKEGTVEEHAVSLSAPLQNPACICMAEDE